MRSSRRGPSPRRRRWGAPGCFLAALLAVCLLCAPALGAEPGALPPICEIDELAEREARLAAMPGAQPPPDGELPFGPRNFGIHKVDYTAMALAGSRIGYRFAAKHGGYRVLNLNWRLGATLRSVDSSGRVQGLLARRHARVGKVKDLGRMDLLFPADRPGFFRIDLRIRDRDNGRSGTYREYFQVLRRSVDVELAVSAPRVRPGESVYVRVLNRGGSKLTAVPAFLDLEREQDATWVPVEQTPTPASVMGIHWFMDSGEATDCQRFDVLPATTPGRYRFTASIYVVNLQERRTYTGGFEVVP